MANVKFEYDEAQVKSVIASRYDVAARASYSAMKFALNDVKTKARANIAAAGFGIKWQNAFRANLYPPNKISIDPAAYFYHKISYAGIFETGGTITPKAGQYLWIPMPNTAKHLGRYKTNPRRWQQTIGPLQLIFSKSGTPLLVAKPNKRQRKSQTRIVKAEPIFFGVRRVTIPDKLNIREIATAAGNQLPILFSRLLKDG